MQLPAGTHRLMGKRLRCWIAVAAGLWLAACAAASDVVVTEPQVKALCVLNFAKYVTWPAEAFASTNAPIRIAITGDKLIHDALKRAAAGKNIGGRPIEVVEAGSSLPDVCHVAFIGASEKSRAPELLKSVDRKPVLTVGDMDGFTDRGGMIVLVKRDNKIRFEVNLAAARAAQVQISSRLLALADAVRGKN